MRNHRSDQTTPRSLAGARGHRTYIVGDTKGRLPWRWRWLGVPVLACSCVLAGWMNWQNTEDGLQERALAHLECEGIETASLSLDWSYRSVEVTGELPPGVTAEQITHTIDRGSSDRGCLDRAGIDAQADPDVHRVEVLADTGSAALVGSDWFVRGAGAVQVVSGSANVNGPDANSSAQSIEDLADAEPRALPAATGDETRVTVTFTG